VVGESAATVKWLEAPIAQDKVEEILPSGKNEPEYAFVKASLGPALVKPLWKASRVFSSEERRKETVERHKRNVGPSEHCYPEFFKYGIRFEPDKDERDVYRTILITELPTDTTMHQVLEKLAGGAIVDAKLLDTMKVTGSMSALINFLHEHAAMEYQEYAHSHPVMINNQLANVKALSTPTWPIAANLKAAINDHHHIRCLEVLNFPRQQVSELKLRSDIRVHAQVKGDRVEHINVRKDGVLELHFSSITYAGQGYGMFTSFRLYKGCKTRFVADPCARPVEALDQDCNTHDQAGIANNMSQEGIAESSA